MDTSYYRNFLTLIETDNMTQAAERLHITQPALSKQLKYLEAEFGTPLLVIRRGQKGPNFHLTDAGEIFYQKAQQLCAIEDATYNAVKGLQDDIDGILRIACAASRSTALIQQYLNPFSTKNPAVRFEVYEGLMADVADSLLKGSAELGLCNQQMVDTDRFEIITYQTEDLYAIYRRDVFWSTGEKECLTWKDISTIPLSLCGGSVQMLMQVHKEDFSALNVVAISTTKSSSVEWAQSGRMVAIIPMDANEEIHRRKLQRLRITDLNNPYQKVFIKVKGHTLSPLANQFMEFYEALRQ